MGGSGKRLAFLSAPGECELERLNDVRLGLLKRATPTDCLRHLGDLRADGAIFTGADGASPAQSTRK